MDPIFGEYDCKVDAKGRFLLPSALKKQLPDDEQRDFVINRGLDRCLILYPKRVWKQEMAEVYKRNQYVKRNRDFARMFINGAKPMELDGNSRVLIPKKLAEYAGIKKEIVVVGSNDRIEIWDQETFNTWYNENFDQMGALSEEVMGESGEQDGLS